ncbi:hypothetical protein [Rubripirellula amarantea]|uniref:hypothetical protein n=1 Tax=Rubripirellula amarantea TaxID=2527999 RepID=UPI0011B59476|nr:hypothetical protein [Rubripirellula amarantea]
MWSTVGYAAFVLAVTFASIAKVDAQESDASNASIFQSVGINGHYRVGSWTGVQLSQPNEDLRIQTRDGDGVRVEFSADDSSTRWVYVIPGSEAAPLVVLRGDEVVTRSRFPAEGSPSRGPAMINSEMPFVQVFGDALGIDQIGENELLRRDATVATFIPTSPDSLPDSSLGYDAIDVMVVTQSGQTVLSEMSEQQQQAVVDWVHAGGQIFLSLGQKSPELLDAAAWLKPLLPFELSGTVEINPSALETATSSQTPLDTFEGLKLPRDMGRIVLMGRTMRRTTTPVAVEYRYGFGRVIVLAADLEDQRFATWPERMDLITQLIGPDMLPPERRDEVANRLTAYNDLSGQLRNSLDRFSLKNSTGFSTIALILMGLIAMIGPLDYWLVNRVLGRPLLGWLSFPVTIVGLSALLAFGARPHVPQTEGADTTATSLMQCNRIEFVDIDAATGKGRGESFNFIYTHDAARLDVDFNFGDPLMKVTQNVHNHAGPFGFPGKAFGGIQIAIEDTRLPAYRAQYNLGHESNSLIKGLPLAPRSSKGVLHLCDFDTSVGANQSLIQRPGSELLQGELVNPLPYDIHGGMLIYRNWVYLLPTRFPAGGRVASLDLLRQKNFRWLLSRKVAIESDSKSEAWNPASTDELDRLAEMLMFHEAVGGTQYTKLKHDALKRLDLSDTLSDNRCILMGQIKEGFTEVLVGDSDKKVKPQGDALSIARVVLPVSAAK